MNLLEFYPKITNGLDKLHYGATTTGPFPDTPNLVNNLKEIRASIKALDGVPFLETEIQELFNSWIFKNSDDGRYVNNSDHYGVLSLINLTRTKLEMLKEIVERSSLFGKEDLLFIKLPELDTFEELSRASNDLKKSIEIPIMDASINGNINILGGDQGSVILYVGVGTILAVNLIAGICWAAAVIKKKKAEARMFEAHAKTLELKNDSLKNLIDAQEQQLKNILQSEAEALASKHYSHNEPEAIERLKLSITSVADLVERGAKILPMNNDVDIQKSFPDYNGMNLIESSIKQLKDSE